MYFCQICMQTHKLQRTSHFCQGGRTNGKMASKNDKNGLKTYPKVVSAKHKRQFHHFQAPKVHFFTRVCQKCPYLRAVKCLLTWYQRVYEMLVQGLMFPNQATPDGPLPTVQPPPKSKSQISDLSENTNTIWGKWDIVVFSDVQLGIMRVCFGKGRVGTKQTTTCPFTQFILLSPVEEYFLNLVI